ncbi:CDGSH iron-sulfur domain-containing protein [Kitasatospora cinereorecta]
MDDEGPLLIEGPVEVTCADGTVAMSNRFLVAVCTCRRSRMYPWCDTSHRRRTNREEHTDAERGRPSAGPHDRTPPAGLSRPAPGDPGVDGTDGPAARPR